MRQKMAVESQRMADRDLANHDARLAGVAEVMPGMDIRLAFIDAASGEDKYHVLQGLKDPTLGGDPKCHFLFQRWGSTGSRDQMHVDGPMLQVSLAVELSKIFKEKTGADFGSVKPGDRALPGKYWLQQQSNPDRSAKWEYYVSDGVDGKRTGWYPYDNYAQDEVEEVYAQHVANGGEGRTATRVVHSGHFKYTVDLSQMTQRNMRTNKVRTIRRSAGDQASTVATRRATKRAREPCAGCLPAMKFMAAGDSASMKVRVPMPAMKSMKVRRTALKVPKKAMKIMKAMKAKRVSKVGSKSQVLKGLKARTKGGMRAADLMKNKNGKVVSKKLHAHGKKAFERNLAKWIEACSKARKELGLTGFVACKKGSEFYSRATALMASQD